jgi:hypothetical protein
VATSISGFQSGKEVRLKVLIKIIQIHEDRDNEILSPIYLSQIFVTSKAITSDTNKTKKFERKYN